MKYEDLSRLFYTYCCFGGELTGGPIEQCREAEKRIERICCLLGSPEKDMEARLNKFIDQDPKVVRLVSKRLKELL